MNGLRTTRLSDLAITIETRRQVINAFIRMMFDALNDMQAVLPHGVARARYIDRTPRAAAFMFPDHALPNRLLACTVA